MKKIWPDILPALFFALLSLAIIFPLFSSGYIFSLDSFAVPGRLLWPNLNAPWLIWQSFLTALSYLLPSYWTQKLMLLAIFFLSGWGMARLVPGSLAVKIFAGLFYSINPFVYERVMAGQWWLLVGYSLVPFILKTQSPVLQAILMTLLFNVSTHYGLAMMVFLAIFYFFRFRAGEKLLRDAVIVAGLVLILNINWLLPTVLGKTELNLSLGQFNQGDLQVFQSQPDARLGLVFNLLSGYGFWAEAHDYFLSPKSVVNFWPVLALVFMGLAIYGAYLSIKKKDNPGRPLALSLIIIFFLALDFAGGVALENVSGFFYALYEKVPLLYGFREPQKLIGFVMLAYAYFGAIGLAALKRLVFALLAIGLVFLYTPTVFGSFWGQLKPAFYPASWSQVNTVLKQDKADYLTVFFPWHQYMRFGFNNNRVVANPAPFFFEKPVLSSRNYETAVLYSHETRPEALHIDGLLRMQQEGRNLAGERVEGSPSWGENLKIVNIKYIILAKDDDWRAYRFLDQQADLKKVFDSPEISLYENLRFN